MAINLVEKDHPRLTTVPCALDDQLKEIAGTDSFDHRGATGTDEFELSVTFNGIHKGIGDADRQIETG